MTTVPGPATPLRFWVGRDGWISLVMRGWQTAVRFLMLGVIMHRARVLRQQPQEQVCDPAVPVEQ